jgi:hypothetical protein
MNFGTKTLWAMTLGVLMSAGVATVTLAPPAALAQAGLGSLAGTVYDPAHSVVPGATVTLINKSTGFSQTATASATGGFRFTALTVADGYVLKVTAHGFKSTELKGLATSVGTTLNIDVTLQIGAQSETVEVTSSQNVEQVQTETAAVSQLIDSEIWQSSPLENRTQNAFVTLTAGAAPDSGTGRGASVDGARTGTGNFLVDGMDNNDQGQGGSATSGNLGGGGAVTTISPDAIQEYRVISHNLPAEYGRSGGFATDTVLKSGTTQWHGSAFEYNRIQLLAADHWFSKQSGLIDHLVRNQFGGSVGGPIYKDRTFFYATVEFHRMRQSQPLTGTTVTPDFVNFVKSGAFEQFQEGTAYQNAALGQVGVCPAYVGTTCQGTLSKSATLGPIFTALASSEAKAIPFSSVNATNIGGGDYFGGKLSATGNPLYANSKAVFTYPVNVYASVTAPDSQALDQNRGSFKLDHRLTNSDQLSATYLIDQNAQTASLEGGASTFGPATGNGGGAQNFSISWTHTFSPTLQNIFRAGYLRHVNNAAVPGTVGIPSISTADALNISFGAADNLPQFFTENEFLYSDTISKSYKDHSFKAGFQFMRTRNGSSFYADLNGTLVPWDVENLLTDATMNDQLEALLGGPNQGSLYEATAAIDPSTNTLPDVYRGYRANEFAAYVQDDWKVTPRLVLNLGVRWDYFGPPHNFKAGLDSNVYFGTFGTPTANGNPNLPQSSLAGALQGAKFIQKDSNIWNKDTGSVGPHFGFSYDVFGNGKLALRGGYAIGYDRLYNNAFENMRFNYPHFADNSIGAGIGSQPVGAVLNPGLYTAPFTGNALFAAWGAKPVPRHIDERLKNAYYEQYSFGFEYQLHSGYVWETNYVGTLGRQLVGLDNINTYPGRTACPTGKTYDSTTACGAAGYTSGYTSGRLNTIFNNDNFRTNGFSSNYNSLQTSLRKGYANGLQFTVNYTYSKALDQVSDVFTQRTALTGPTNSWDKSYDYGPADFDMRHNLTVTANYKLPWKKNNYLLGGWSVSPILKMYSGTPFTPDNSAGSYNPLKDGRTGDRTVYVGTGSVKNAINHGVSPAAGYLKTSLFANYTCPTSQMWCEPPVGRNILTGPAYKDLDLSFSKHFKTFENQGFTLAGSLFNAFNHPNFGNPAADANGGNYGNSITTSDPRITQLSLRYDF